MPTQERSPSWPHLRDDTPSEISIFGDHVGNTKREEVQKSLDFMENCVSVWHFGSVNEGWRAMRTNHLVNLLADSLCTEEGDQRTSFKEAFQQGHSFLSAHEPEKIYRQGLAH